MSDLERLIEEIRTNGLSEESEEKLRSYLGSSSMSSGEDGDALATLERDLRMLREYADEGADHDGRHDEITHAYHRVRRHLTASGVPDEIRKLPDKWRKEGDPLSWMEESQIDDLESAIARAEGQDNGTS